MVAQMALSCQRNLAALLSDPRWRAGQAGLERPGWLAPAKPCQAGPARCVGAADGLGVVVGQIYLFCCFEKQISLVKMNTPLGRAARTVAFGQYSIRCPVEAL